MLGDVMIRFPPKDASDATPHLEPGTATESAGSTPRPGPAANAGAGSGGKRPFRLWITAVLPLALAGLATFFALHADYYLAPLREQVDHPEHGLLRSSRGAGLAFGALAATLVVLNLSYLVRRRFARQRRLGSLRAWMDLHVTTGLVAGGCVLLHSALGLRSSMGGMAAFSFSVVGITGLIGRYLYSRVPRSIEGRELRLEELHEEYSALLASLRDLGVRTDFEARPAEMPYGSTIKTFFGVIAGSGELRRRLRETRRSLVASGADAATRRRALPLLRRLVREHAWIRRYHDLRRLMASWRFLHRWLALTMIGAVLVHVATALLFANLSLRPGG